LASAARRSSRRGIEGSRLNRSIAIQFLERCGINRAARAGAIDSIESVGIDRGNQTPKHFSFLNSFQTHQKSGSILDQNAQNGKLTNRKTLQIEPFFDRFLMFFRRRIPRRMIW